MTPVLSFLPSSLLAYAPACYTPTSRLRATRPITRCTSSIPSYPQRASTLQMARGPLIISLTPGVRLATQGASRRVLPRAKARWPRHRPSPLPLRRAYSPLYWRRRLRNGRARFIIPKTRPFRRRRNLSSRHGRLDPRRSRARPMRTRSRSRREPPRRRRALRHRPRARARANSASRRKAASRP